MKRAIIIQLGLAVFLVVSTSAFSQDTSPQPCPEVTDGTLGCEPVAWSQLQDPVPLPEQNAEPTPDGQPDAQTSQSTTSQTEPQTPKQSIKGIIVKEGEKFVLKAGDTTTYQLDDQNKAGQFQDKRVNVVGTLDVDSNTLHIESIELLS
jgi:hypothetical protein